ncbi:MAG: hypothetical protein COA54_04605 [Thiotrichaceae bacterium]|nr:MAG: hypothetical protein COA54_04605 [Thiotrichaceae bacterium]
MNIPNKKPDNHILYALLAGIHLSVAPLYTSMSLRILALLGLLSLVKILLIRYNRKDPSFFLQLLTIAALFFIILDTYGHIFGQQSGLALITIMTTLKLFEIKKNRDCYIVIYSSFFIIASTFFHSQSIWLFLYVFIVVLFLLSVLILLSDRLKSTTLKGRFKISSQFIYSAIPLMIILFFLFPRLPGPLWALPNDTFTSKTGLSEEMSPGSINRLISSSAIAFRVKFENTIPAQADRYWRGAVLSSYDGKTWKRSDAQTTAVPNIKFNTETKNDTHYRITLEPTYLKWLVSLEYPFDYPSQYHYSREAMLLSKKAINSVISYPIGSQTTAINQSLFKQESYKNRLLPINLNPETIKFANKLAEISNYDAKTYINNVLSHFRNNDFIYTLNPDLLGSNAMDDFLFKTQKGFCEHYASAFVYLARAAGIPARVVVGYQGGEMNPLDDYMIVRQSDAHAWSEVWLDNRWVRIDPTAAVSPERVEQGVLNAGLELNKLPLLLTSNSMLLKNMSYLYDSFQNNWNNWVVGFNQKKQEDLMELLGFENTGASNLILLLVSLMSIIGLIITWLFLKQVSVSKDRVQHYYNLYCLKLKKHGVQRRLNEGPKDFENRIYNELTLSKQTRNNMAFIFKAYRSLHYGSHANENLKSRYYNKIKSFKIKK